MRTAVFISSFGSLRTHAKPHASRDWQGWYARGKCKSRHGRYAACAMLPICDVKTTLAGARVVPYVTEKEG
jgi:hypothetical protein